MYFFDLNWTVEEGLLPTGLNRSLIVHPHGQVNAGKPGGVLRRDGRLDADAIRTLADNMLETMYAANGIGLAAPQVDENIQLVVIHIPDDEEEGESEPMAMVNGELVPVKSIMPLVFINPVLEPYGKKEFFLEGCLSVHNIRANVARPTNVKATLTQLDGSVLEIDCGGLLARCLQHECDHLDGFLFVDRVSSAAKITLAKKLKRLAEQR